MTREYAAVQLLRLGPLSLSQFYYITCWPSYKECHQVLEGLRKSKKIRMRNARGIRLYEAEYFEISQARIKQAGAQGKLFNSVRCFR